MHRTYRQKIDKETANLKNTTHQANLTSMSRTFHPTAAEYIFFSSAHGTFSMTDHMLDPQKSLNKFKIEIIPSTFSDHNKI